jgi:uncharacterized repeat protein (TIGR01451 family)
MSMSTTSQPRPRRIQAGRLIRGVLAAMLLLPICCVDLAYAQGALISGQNHTGDLSGAGEIDSWTFTAPAGAAIVITAAEVGPDSSLVPRIVLRAPDGTSPLGWSDFGAVAAAIPRAIAPEAGTYTVEVRDANASATGDYALRLAVIPGPFTVPSGDEGGTLTNGGNHAGSIDVGDLDVWTFTAAEGASILVAIGEVGDDPVFRPSLQLIGPDGAGVGSGNGTGVGLRAAQIGAIAPQAGTYTVVVASSFTVAEGAGSYLLTLALTPAAFVVPSGDEGGPMTNATNHPGSIHVGDLDQWTFTATQGATIDVTIVEVGSDSQFVPAFHVRGPNGTTLAFSAGQSSTAASITAPLSGLYTVVATTNDGGFDGSGDYLLSVEGASTPAGGANLQMTKAVSHVGVTLTYTLTVTNIGPDPASAVVVTDTLPSGVTFESCSAPEGTCGGSGNARTVSYPSLASGATRTITLITSRTVAAGVPIVNTASVTSSTPDPIPGNNSASVTANAAPDPADTDGDNLPTEWETRFGLDPGSASGDNGANGDPDGDSLTNAQELTGGTHPRGFVARFLAEGAINTFFDVRLALLNVGTQDARLLFRYLQPGGVVLARYQVLPVGRRLTLTAADLQALTSPDFSTVVESDQPIVVDRTMSWANGVGSHAETGVPAPSTTWYLAEGSTSGPFSLFYLLQNPNPAPTTATVRYLRPSGAPPIERTYSLAALSRRTIPVDDQGPDLGSTDVSAVITAPLPIIVERAMYWSTPSQAFAAGHGATGVTAAATRWFLAEGATGPFFDCFILLANPNPQAASVTIEYLLLDGTVLTKDYVVPPEGRFTVWVDDEQIPQGSGQRPLDNVAVSSTFTSNLPIIVERTMWWPGPAITPDFWTEAHNSVGATATGTRWALAEGEVGGPQSAETYILIANTSQIAGTARVTLYFEDGATATRTFNLLPRSRRNVSVSSEFPAAAGRRFGALIESLDTQAGPAAQIVVERAMYTSPGGATWTAGTNALATRLP